MVKIVNRLSTFLYGRKINVFNANCSTISNHYCVFCNNEIKCFITTSRLLNVFIMTWRCLLYTFIFIIWIWYWWKRRCKINNTKTRKYSKIEKYSENVYLFIIIQKQYYIILLFESTFSRLMINNNILY